MGNSVSSLSLNVPDLNQFDYFAIQMDRHDRLRLIMAPQYIIDTTTQTVAKSWPVQDVRVSPGFAELKLQGFPWHSRSEDDLLIKFFICSLIQQYAQLGWQLKSSSDLNSSDNDMSVIFFEKCVAVTQPSIVCLSFNGFDKIRVLGPEDVVNITRAVISSWSGVQREQPYGTGYEFKVVGNPWAWENQRSPNLVNELLSNMYANGWHFIGAIDTAVRDEGLNALYFQKSQEAPEIGRFFSVSLHHSDKFRMHAAPEELIHLVRNILSNSWPEGIQREEVENHCFEFKLNGFPWQSHGSDAVKTRVLLNNVFGMLSQHGWQLYATCDISKSSTKKSTFFFQYKQVVAEPINFCFSLNEWNKFRVINGSSSVIDNVRSSIVDGWPRGIRDEGQYKGSWQFKLHGQPFSQSWNVDNIHAVGMMLYCMHRMKALGFKFICSADLSAKQHDGNSRDVHSFFFSGGWN